MTKMLSKIYDIFLIFNEIKYFPSFRRILHILIQPIFSINTKKKWVVSKCVKYVKIRRFCVEKVRIEALKGKIFNFNENKENHRVYPSAYENNNKV